MKAEPSQVQRIVWLDAIRLFAMFGVVLVHVSSGPVVYYFDTPRPSYWWAGNLYDSSMRMVSLLFFMISGYLLLAKEEPFSVLIKKRVLKLVTSLLFWSLFYLLWSWVWSGQIPDLRMAVNILFQPAAVHFWFLYALLGLYLILPFLRLLVKKVEPHLQIYFLIIWLAVVVLLPVLERILGLESIYNPGLVLNYTGYMILGYWLGQLKPNRQQFFAAMILAILAVSVNAGGTYWLFSRTGKVDLFFYERNRPQVLLLALCSWQIIRFLVEKYTWFQAERAQAFLHTAGRVGIGVYILHPIFITMLQQGTLGFRLDATTFHPLLSIPVVTLVTFLLSAGASWLIQRLPGGRWVLP